eukprot:SAG31_NODE_1088_length_9973_cov_3.175309_3_plen_349_part_00
MASPAANIATEEAELLGKFRTVNAALQQAKAALGLVASDESLHGAERTAVGCSIAALTDTSFNPPPASTSVSNVDTQESDDSNTEAAGKTTMVQIPRGDCQFPDRGSTWLPGRAELTIDPDIRPLSSMLEHPPHVDNKFSATKRRPTDISCADSILTAQTVYGASDAKQNTSSLAQAVHQLIRAVPTDVQPNLLRRAATKLAEGASATVAPQIDNGIWDESWPVDQARRLAPTQTSGELTRAHAQFMEHATTTSAQNARREAWSTACEWKEAALWQRRELSMERQVTVVENARCIERAAAHSRRAAQQRAAKSEQRWEKAKLAAARRVTLHCATTNMMHMPHLLPVQT